MACVAMQIEVAQGYRLGGGGCVSASKYAANSNKQRDHTVEYIRTKKKMDALHTSHPHIKTGDRQTDRQTDRQKDKQTNKQTNKQTQNIEARANAPRVLCNVVLGYNRDRSSLQTRPTARVKKRVDVEQFQNPHSMRSKQYIGRLTATLLCDPCLVVGRQLEAA